MGKIRNCSCYNDILPVFSICQHRANEGICICSRIFSIRVSTCFSIIPNLMGISEISKSIGDDDRRASSACEKPYVTFWVQNTKFETCPCLIVELLDIFFCFTFFTSKRMSEGDIFPELLFAIPFGCIDFCNHIKTDSLIFLVKSKWIDFEISQSSFHEKRIEYFQKILDSFFWCE